MHCLISCSLSPAAGERAGEKGLRLTANPATTKPSSRFKQTAGPCLLILDGLEKVQDDGARGGVFGELQDGRLSDLLVRVAEGCLPLFWSEKGKPMWTKQTAVSGYHFIIFLAHQLGIQPQRFYVGRGKHAGCLRDQIVTYIRALQTSSGVVVMGIRLFGYRQFMRTQRHWWIAHWPPVFVGAVVDPDLKDGGQQPAHHDEAVFQGGAVQAAAHRWRHRG